MPHRLHYRKPLTSLSTYIKFCSRTLAVDDQSEETVPRLKSVWSLVRNALGEPLPAYQELTIAGDRCRSGEDSTQRGRERGYHEAEPNDGINRLKTRMTNAHSPSSKEVDLKHQLPGLLRPPVGDLWDSVEVEEVAKHGTLPTSKDKDQVAHKLTTVRCLLGMRQAYPTNGLYAAVIPPSIGLDRVQQLSSTPTMYSLSTPTTFCMEIHFALRRDSAVVHNSQTRIRITEQTLALLNKNSSLYGNNPLAGSLRIGQQQRQSAIASVNYDMWLPQERNSRTFTRDLQGITSDLGVLQMD
ncbi:hypothetical protein KEM48_011247 [Puccinia striiformis f. sp. tritici PST-130]|nr:hypothetical protein KEM48_011247 [Puccinia striiformis f. sp. tritici PST-130]